MIIKINKKGEILEDQKNFNKYRNMNKCLRKTISILHRKTFNPFLIKSELNNQKNSSHYFKDKHKFNYFENLKPKITQAISPIFLNYTQKKNQKQIN